MNLYHILYEKITTAFNQLQLFLLVSCCFILQQYHVQHAVSIKKCPIFVSASLQGGVHAQAQVMHIIQIRPVRKMLQAILIAGGPCSLPRPQD